MNESANNVQQPISIWLAYALVATYSLVVVGNKEAPLMPGIWAIEMGIKFVRGARPDLEWMEGSFVCLTWIGILGLFLATQLKGDNIHHFIVRVAIVSMSLLIAYMAHDSSSPIFTLFTAAPFLGIATLVWFRTKPEKKQVSQ